MKNKLLWVLITLLAVGLVVSGCSLLKKEKTTEAPISVETPPATPETAPPTTAPETTPPAGPTYAAGKLDVLKQLDQCLGATASTLGWDNIYCSVCLDKDVDLFTQLQPLYAAGTTDRTFIDQSIKDLTDIKNFVSEKLSKAEGIDPNGTDAQAKRKRINEIRARVQAMIGGPAPTPVPEWKGDLMKKKWDERGEMMKKKWAERGKK